MTTNLGQPNDVVAVYLGQGNGTFQNNQTYAVGQGAAALVTADFNGDGGLDLATANTGSQNLSVLLGYGDGRFQAQITDALPFA